MRRLFFSFLTVLFVCVLTACSNSGQTQQQVIGNEDLTVEQRAKEIISNIAQAFKGVDLENDDEGFSEAVAVLEGALDEAYDSYETDEQKKAFSEALGKAVESMDADVDVKMVCAAHVRVY